MNLKSFKIDKSGWELVSLGELAEEVSLRVDNPSESSHERFVGLEHFVSGELKIKKWSSTENLTSSTKAFKTGDILFARRNAYLRRASLVEFDGICSGDAFVLRENHDKVIPGFLAFVFNSNLLWDYAVSNAAGTMSTRVKWRDLANYEFLLPPKDQQAQIAELLWAMDDVVEKNLYLLEILKVLLEVKIDEYIPRQFHDTLLLNNVIKIRRGVTYSSTDYSDVDNGLPLLNLKSIGIGGGFNPDGIKFFKGEFSESHLTKENDLLVACTDLTRAGNVIGFPLDPCVYKGKQMLFTMDLIAIQANEDFLLRDFLYYVFKSKWVHWKLFAHSPGTTVLHLDSNGILKLAIPNISITKQQNMVNSLKKIEENIKKVDIKISASRSLQKSLINQVF